MQDILEGLNNKQYEAVTTTEGPCLVIAGAGSGKTKVLTHKIAYLIQEKGAKPWDILAITFTNKAANEMKERIANLVGEIAKDIWMGTFHSICVRILRRFIDRIGFETSFIIFDTSDQKTLVKNCLKDLSIDDKLFNERAVMSEISNTKNEMLTPAEYQAKAMGDFRKEKIATVYELYQKRLKENKRILKSRIDKIQYASEVKIDKIYKEYQEEEYYLRYRDIDDPTDKDVYKLFEDNFSKYTSIKGLDTSRYSIITIEEICGEYRYNHEYILKKINKKVNSHKLVVKQKGEYLIGYHKGYYNTIEQTYDKMTIYAKDNNLVIGSNSYTKEILDVLTSNSKEEYLIEIIIELK